MAQSLAGTAILSNALAMARTICYELRIAWGRTAETWPTDWATQSVNESARLIDVSWDRRFNLSDDLSLGQAPVAQMRFTLSNFDQRYSPFNNTGPLYANLSSDATTASGISVRYSKMWQVPVRLRMGFVDSVAGAQYLTVFSGLIDRPDEAYGVGGDRLSIMALDRAGSLLDNRQSSGIYPGFPDEDGDIAPDAYLRILLGKGGIETGALDYGLTVIPYAWLDDEALWSEIQAVAASDSGYAFFDELGVFQFKNATWWAIAPGSTVSQATFNPAHFTNLEPIINHANIATGAIAEYQPRSHGGEQVVWRSSSTLVLPPGVTIIEAKFSYPVTLLLDAVCPTDWLPVSGGGIDMSDLVELSYLEPRAQRVQLYFSNNGASTVYVSNMRLRGYVLIGGPQELVQVDATEPLVPIKRHRLAGNSYMQTWQQANIAARLAANRLRYPRLTYRVIGPAMPWLQLGDRVTIDAPEPLTASRDAIITGLAFKWQADGPWLMTVDAVDMGGLFEHGNYHVVGATAYSAGVCFA